MDHKQHKCQAEHCSVCRGDLNLCTVCKSFEGEQPTECPGREMTTDECDQVYAGTLDFKNDKWVDGLV